MKLTAMAALLLLFAGSAIADDVAAQWRVGGSVAYSQYETDDSSINAEGTGFKFFSQYRFNEWAGIEGAYYISPDFDDDLTPNTAGGESQTTYQGFTINAIAYLPPMVERMDFFVKGGYFNFDADLKVDNVTNDTGSDDGLALGFGAAVDAIDNIGIRVEFDWYDVSSSDLWTVGIGAEYRF